MKELINRECSQQLFLMLTNLFLNYFSKGNNSIYLLQDIAATAAPSMIKNL